MSSSSHLCRTTERPNSACRVSPLLGEAYLAFQLWSLPSALAQGLEKAEPCAGPPAAALQAPSSPVSLLRGSLEKGATEEKRAIFEVQFEFLLLLPRGHLNRAGGKSRMMSPVLLGFSVCALGGHWWLQLVPCEVS